MKQLMTYVEDGHIDLAYVEDDSGELTQIGRLIWPEGYGLQEAATLALNLTPFLQLNGHKPKKKATTPPALEAGPQPEVVDTSGASEAKRKTLGRPKGGRMAGRRYISLDEIVALVTKHPGLTTAELGRIYNGGTVVDWVTKAFSNRLQGMRSMPNPPLRYEKVAVEGHRAPVYRYWPTAAAVGSTPESKAEPTPAPKKVNRFIDSKDLVALVQAHPGLTALEVAHLYSPGANDAKLNKMVTDRLRNMAVRGEVTTVKEETGHGAQGYRYRYHPVAT